DHFTISLLQLEKLFLAGHVRILSYQNYVRPKVCDAVGNVLVAARNQRHYEQQRTYGEDHAEQGQKRAQLVSTQRFQRDHRWFLEGNDGFRTWAHSDGRIYDA